MTWEEAKLLLRQANEAVRKGYTRAEVDQHLQARYRMSYDDLTQMVRAAPKLEPDVKELTTKDVVRLQAYGATLGWLDELQGLWGVLKGTKYETARKAALEEIERVRRDYPKTALFAMGLGGTAAGAAAALAAPLAGGTLAAEGTTGLPMLARFGPGVTRAAVGGLLGGAAAGGGLPGTVTTRPNESFMGEASGARRAINAGTGLLAGAAMPVAAASRAAPTLAKYLLPTAGLGLLGKYLLDR